MNACKKQRPIGVSGLMRVMNEEEYVEASIDSVIHALDELIICYHECSDRTPEILTRKQQQYPDKIKLYHYAPKVYAYDLTPEELVYACSLPDDSPHLVHNYNNYTLNKATYRYAVKIDADQIYFSERMQQVCDAYRADQHFKLSIWERIALKCLFGGEDYRLRVKKILVKLLSVFFDFGSLYQHAVLKKIANDKCLTWLSGINLFRKNGLYYVPTGSENAIMYNGTHDHCFFEITDETYYYPVKQLVDRCFANPLMEIFHLDPAHERVDYGFMWYHMRGCKKSNEFSMIGVSGIELRLLANYTYKEMKKRGWFVFPDGLKGYEIYFSFFHDFRGKYDFPAKL